jgi:DNA-binding transcriptional LysR family regulator
VDFQTRSLRSFIVLAEELNFTRAAERLYLTQQALSAQMKRLETEVGSSLFSRTTRSVELTAAGRALLPSAQSAVAAADAAEPALRAARSGRQTQLNLGFVGGAALELTSPIMEEYARRRPDVALNVRQVHFHDPTMGLGDRSSDVALMRPPVAHPEIVYEPLFAEPRVAVVAVDHPLAGCGSICLADIIDEPLIAAFTNDKTWDDFWLAADARPDGQRPVISHRVNSLEEELILVATQGAVTITAQAAARFSPRSDVAFVPIADIAPTVGAVAWRRDSLRDGVMDFVRAALAARDATGGDNGLLSISP